MSNLFIERILPVLTPLAVDPSHPFPYISGLAINLGVLLRDPRTREVRFARAKLYYQRDRVGKAAKIKEKRGERS